MEFKEVANQRVKVDGIKLVTGKPIYTDDIDIKGLLHCKLLHSPHAHARIKNIDVSKAKALDGVVDVATYKDITNRVQYTTAGQGPPEPSPKDTFLLDNKMRFIGDKVAAVVAETREIAEEALGLIDVEWEILPALLDPEKSMDPDSPKVHETPAPNGISTPEKNIAAQIEATDGDMEKGFSESDIIVEHRYDSPYVQGCPMEPHITITYIDEDNRLVVRTSTQVPWHVRRIVSTACGIPVQRIRVIKPRIGGGFGHKQDIVTEDICAFMTLRTNRPVKLELTRKEELAMSRARHPEILWVKTGVRKDGKLMANSMKMLANTGAYGNHCLTVPNNTGTKSMSLYKTIEYTPGVYNVSFKSDIVYTNLLNSGALRGYGAPQGHFAVASQMDECAYKLGMDPIDFLMMNIIEEGDYPPLLEKLGEGKEGIKQLIRSCKLPECIEVGKKEFNWDEKRKAPKSDDPIKRGVGMAIIQQGSGIPGVHMGSCTIKMNEDGSFNLLIGAADLGTGSDTTMAQIAAETLGTFTDKFIVYSSDTDFTPFDAGAYASSTTYITGNAVIKAAKQVKEKIINRAAKIMHENPDTLFCEESFVKSRFLPKQVSFAEVGTHALYKDEQEQIIASASNWSNDCPPPFAANFAEVEVDTETGKVKVLKYLAVVDCGTAINTNQAEGQMEGGIHMGLGYVLSEKLILNDKGKIINTSLKDYKIFSAMDMPEIKIILIPSYEPAGPYGAKSVSEMPVNGPAPTISNAIFNAVGIRIRDLPITSEKILKALKEKR